MTGGQFVSAITYSTSGQFTKNKERIQEFMKTGDTCYIYRHDMANASYKNLVKRTE